jgi:hypothetical protein
MKETIFESPDIPLQEQRKYLGKHVALVDGKIVASGRTSLEVFEKAQKKFPQKGSDEIELLFIPKGDLLIL